MKRKKLVALVITAAVAVTSLAGCGNEKSDTEKSKEASNVVSNSFPLTKESSTLKIMVGKGASEVSYQDMDVFKEYEKKTNVHVEWDNPTSDNYKERYNLVMASGELPDIIINIPVSSDITKYGQAGAFLTLNDYINKDAPNLKALLSKYPATKKAITQDDGKIYNLAGFNPYTDAEKSSARMNYPLIIRQDWLTKLNLKEPVTTDDWYNVLKAFKTQDPNGNGKQDEIPFGGNSIWTVETLARAWGVDTGFYLSKDQKEVHYGPVEPKFKEAITWISKLYNEGLIDKEIATNDEKAFQAKVAQNLVGATRGLLGGHLRTFNETLPKTIPGLKYVGTEPIKGPNGDQREPIGGVDGCYTVITKSCKNPDLAMKWLDYFYSDEGSVFVAFGPTEGKTYTKGSDGHYHYTDFVQKNPDGKSAKQAIGTFSPIQNAWPSLFCYDTNIEMNPQYSVDALKKMAPYAVPNLPNITVSQADDETRRTVMADVDTYVSEELTKFIIGKEPISNWDSYVSKVKAMGIEKVIKIDQDGYNKWLKR